MLILVLGAAIALQQDSIGTAVAVDSSLSICQLTGEDLVNLIRNNVAEDLALFLRARANLPRE